MRSSVVFALISLNIACWTTIAAADDTTQGTTGKGGKIVAAAPRQVDTTHGVSTTPDRTGAPVLTAAASFIGAGVVTVGGGNVTNVASVATMKTGLYTGLTMTDVSAAGVRTESTLIQAVGTVTSRTGADRTGALASFGNVVSAAARPMGNAATANFIAGGVRRDAVLPQSPVLAARSVFGAAAAASSKASLAQGTESTNVRATVLADMPTGIYPARRVDGVTPRAVGVWNSVTSMGGPAQRVKPVRTTR